MTAIFSFLIGFIAGALINAIGARQREPAYDPADVTRRHLAELLRAHRIDHAVYHAVMDALEGTPEPTVERTVPSAPPTPVSNDVVVAELIETARPATPKTEVPAQIPSPTASATQPPTAPSKPPPVAARDETQPVAPSKLPLQERARVYMERRSAAEQAQQLETPPAPAEPPTPWSVWFASFMEEKNIRWGELVGGLLIVSCSVALVISFWKSIAEEPLLKFGVLNGVTAALFGLGLHAARRWKLPTTSQGILITSSLLVPLNFLAIAAFSEASATPTLTGLIGEAVSILMFATLVYFGSRVISPRWSIPLLIGVMVPSVWQLVIRRHIDAASTVVPLYAFSLVSLFVFAGSCLFVVPSVKNRARVPERRANELLKQIGIVAFSMLVAQGLLLAKSERVGEVLELLSPLSILVAFPVFLYGVVLWKRPGASDEGLRLVGSSLCVAAVFVLIAGCIAAWPQPALITALTMVGFACVTWIAIDLRIPDAHLVAAVFLLPVLVLTGNVMVGNLSWMGETSTTVIQQSTSALTGRFLTGFAYLGIAVCAGLLQLRRGEVAWRYAAVCIGSAVVGLLLVGFYGIGRVGDPEHLTLILGLHTVSAIVAAFALRNAWAMIISGALLLAALFQGLQFGPVELDLGRPWLVTVLAHATVMGIVAAVAKLRFRAEAERAVCRAAWSWSLGSALLSSIALVVIMGPNLMGTATDSLAIYLAWLSVIWLALAVVDDSSELFSSFQVTLALALMAGVDRALHGQSWYASLRFGWLHPTALLCQGIALTLYSLSWIGVRTALRRNWLPAVVPSSWRQRLADWLAPSWIGVDRSIGVVSLCILLLLTIYGVVPGIAQELTPMTGPERVVPAASNYELLGIPHQPAHGLLAWALLGVLFVTQAIALLDAPRRWNLTAVVLVASTIPLLIASHWSSTVSVASATRWACSIFFMLGSVLIWMRRPILDRLRERHWLTTSPRRDLHWFSFGLLVIFSSAPLLAMAVFVALAAVTIQPPDADQLTWLTWLTVICLATFVALWATSAIPDEKRAAWRTASGSLAVLGAMPLFAMTLFVVGQGLASHPIVGPDAESFFTQVGLSISYAVPLLLLSVALVGHAINLRAASVAFAAGLLLCFSGTAAYLLAIKGVDLADVEQWLRLGQLNSIIATVYSLGWVAMLRGPLKIPPASAGLNWLKAHIGIGVGFLAIPIVALTIHLGLRPSSSLAIHQVAGVWGGSALALAIASTVVYFLYERRTVPIQAILVSVAFVCAMVALQSQILDVGSGASWQSFHLLQVMTLAVGLMLIGVDRYESGFTAEDYPSPGISACLLAIIGWLVLLGLRGIGGDPTLPWWSMFSLLAAAGVASERGDRLGRQRYLFAAAALVNLAVSLWWVEEGHKLSRATGIAETGIDLLCINVIAACSLIPLWLWIGREFDQRRILPRVQAAAIWLAMGAYALTVGVGLLADYWNDPLDIEPWTNNLALATLVGGSICLFWQRHNQVAVLASYFAGLAAMATFLDRIPLAPEEKTWVSTMLVSAFGLGTSYLWSRREGLAVLAQRLRIPVESESRIRVQSWLVPLNACLAGVVIALGFWVQLTCAVSGIRLAASQAIAVQAFAMGMLARGRRETELRLAALLIGVVAAVAFGWSWINPNGPMATWLNRMVVVTSALMAMAAFYGIGLVKLMRRENQWTAAARQLVPLLVALGTGSVVVVLIGEVSLFALAGDTGMQWPSIIAVALALVVATVACLVAAVVPGRDPLGLAEKRRTIYVYAAEALLAILFLHVRVTVPELFAGIFQRYWTLIVMAIAFAGVGLAEWFRRREQAVLSEPLEKTGALLPLLPVIGFWVTSSEVDYTVLMLVVGLLYAALCVMRRSFGFGVLAALAANGGLWYFLQNTASISFLVHPQLWLIPGAVCVLVAAYLNRRQLSESQMTTIRYLSTSVIYTSSTADIFINGVGNAPWLPVILAGLSIAGIFAGIWMRVRAFLFLGLSFLAISLMTVIWHAAVDLQQTWLWYVTGIVAGIMIITVFAVFERKRQEVLHVVDRLKSWDA